ncbi:Uma2 family endonuclease [Kamptonema sp. UHCC 0994]|uniref:Uma2 family endonuclease n=1 Tax=Kamptonema sp. UHCC 0994 TaxID=3031329 RepID=UPI0023B99CA6|nr:Uma2 family endonuclease [Kamptonema sp. UHCC 0994]MDF0555450.1 Uma2 family endonuclease [Kamptonema sp. UHCC 0994]
MIAISTPAEQRTVLENISWETFEAILKEIGDNRGSRLAYDEGILEIMTPLFEHEIYKSNLGNLIIVLAEELNIEIKSAGSTTLKIKVVKKGIEPDNCYYIENESAVRGKLELDLETAPPPDLAIEIDITSSSVDKFGIYASLGVPELWRYNGRILEFYQLVESEYIECEFSIAFTFLSATDMTRFVEQSKTIGEIALIKLFRDWLQTR